jgi:hypothetical protein
MKHRHDNDGLAMPASVAHRGMDLFAHRHGREAHCDGHQHHQSPATASDPRAISPRWSQWPRRHGARISSLAGRAIGVMSGSTNTFFAGMNGTVQAMGDQCGDQNGCPARVATGWMARSRWRKRW